MGTTHYVTMSAAEYAALQRIVGIARATVKGIPSVYANETAVLRQALDEYAKQWNGAKR